MNIPKQAIALSYDEKTAPKLTAKGNAKLAEEIIELAQFHGIPLYENAELVSALAQLELGEEIPEVLYKVIAEVIAFAFYLQGKTPQGFNPSEI